jgi:DNA-binding beta-propeller fold protein YncE
VSLRLLIVSCLVAITAVGCAGPQKQFRISEFPDARDGAWPVWPKGDQVPRFVYVGDLTGEQNYAAADAAGGARGVLAWLVGLGQELREPIVLRRPQGVAEGADGRIWVTDVSRQAVFLFDPQAGELQVFDTIDEQRRFVAPIGVAPLPDGGVLVSDAELKLIVDLSPQGEVRAIIGEGMFERPTGLAYDAATGNIFVADTRANRIKVIDSQGDLVQMFGEEGEASGQLNAPTYIAVSQDRIYVTDTLNARIQVFDKAGGFQTHFAERGLYIGNLTRPKGIAVSDEGLVYVVESYYDYLLIFDEEGQLLLPIGGTGHRPGQFYLPSGVWAGEGGRVYVSDMFNGRVAVLQFLGENL